MRSLACLSILAATCILPAAGCGEDDPYADADPRCASICAIEEPAIEGAGDVCDLASARLCLDNCATRLVDVSTVCGTCLLEQADFGLDQEVGDTDFCTETTCEMSGREGTCSYPTGDDAAREACERQVNPRREVACQAESRPVSECAAPCGQ